MDIVTLDWETYYDKDFSLSKMTTEEYVRDPRFEIIGVGVKFNNNSARWFTGNGIAEVIRIIPWSKVALLCHNTNFDGFILKDKFGVVPRVYLDTLSMAKPWHGYNVGGSLAKLVEHYQLGAKGTEVVDALGKRVADFDDEQLRMYGEYCKNDCELTYALFHKLKTKTPMQELLLIDRTVRMFCDAKLLLDPVPIQEEIEAEVERKEELMAEVEHIAPKEVLMSNPQFALLLESLGVDVPTKISARTGKETYAFGKTDKAFTALLDYTCPHGSGNDELVQALVAARLGVKSTIGETRARRMLGVAERGPLPVDIQYCGALVTQRWSGGSKLNLQNLPRGGRLRRAIRAPDGMVIVAVDSSNIELRVAHCIAGQTDTVQSLREGRDLYCEFATILFDRPITKADKAERQLGKLAMLSLQYGAGANKFREMVRIQAKIALTEAEAERTVKTWRATYSGIPKLWRACDHALQMIADGNSYWIDTQTLVQTSPDGLKTKPDNQILYPELQQDKAGQWFYLGRNKERKKLWGGVVVENVCQHLARNIIAEQLLRISARYPVVMTVHDEVVYLAPEAEADEAVAFGIAEMSKSPVWWPAIPLAAEGESGVTYS